MVVASKDKALATTTLDCLQNILNETQETIRAYDTKAEVLAILLTLVVGTINFSLISDSCKSHCAIKMLSVISISLGLLTLFAAGMVLCPRKNMVRGIDTGNYLPKRTYFVSLDIAPQFNSLDEYLRCVDLTNWKNEVAYEVLKASRIRDNKHFWFNIGIMCAAITLLCILALLIGIAYYA